MPAGSNHTVKAFDEDLEELRAVVALLGGRGEAAIEAAVHSLTQFDDGAYARAADLAGQIDAFAQDVEQRAICLIALRAPMADDLRGIVVALKIAQLIQRLGCLALDMTWRLDWTPLRIPLKLRSELAQLGAVSVEALKSSLDAFGAQDAAAAAAASRAGAAAKALFEAGHRLCLIDAQIDRRSAIGLLLAAQSLAHCAALSSEVARLVHFAATGAPLTRPLDPYAPRKAIAHG